MVSHVFLKSFKTNNMQKILFKKVTVRPLSEAGKSEIIQVNARKAIKILEKKLIGARFSTGVNKCYILTALK